MEEIKRKRKVRSVGSHQGVSEQFHRSVKTDWTKCGQLGSMLKGVRENIRGEGGFHSRVQQKWNGGLKIMAN